MALPPYMPWAEFLQWFAHNWKVGEHVAGIGETGSGKTTFFRNVLQLRSWACVMGTKSRDEDLYPALEAKGFVKVEAWKPDDWEETRERYVIFAPPLEIPDDATDRELAEAEDEQAGKFRTAMIQLNKVGGWCVDFDEIATVAIDLGLKRPLNLMYREGRSKSLTIVAGTQRPREVPLNVFQQSKWLIIWQIADYDDRARASQFAGPLQAVVNHTIARLPRYEFVAIHKPSQSIVRSRVGG